MKTRKFSFLVAAAVLLALLAAHAGQGGGGAVRRVSTSHRILALTFDDGPHPVTTPALLAVLAEKNVPATFFVLGENAEKYPGLLARIAADGHELASHGYRHRFPNRQDRDELFADLARTEQAIVQVAPAPALFRPPGGGYNDGMVTDLALRGYTTVLWSVDPRDWQRSAPSTVAAAVARRAAPGAIVLLHEGEAAANTPQAVGEIIDRLQAAGYRFVTVGELLQYAEIAR